MSGKRKDKKGRVLRKGESYRSSDNRYMYRYTDPFGMRKYIYDKDLNELREKEKEIEKLLASGVDYTRGLITVGELVKRYVELRQWRASTEKVIKGAVNRILADPISSRMIKDVKIIDAKEFALKLSSGGLKRKSISTYFNILRPAFDLAIEDNAIAANPFSFSLASILRNDSETREAISYDEQERLIEFMSNDTRACKFVDDVVILLGTGLRVSELYGLTRSDVDFDEGTISVTKQLVKTNGVYHVTEPKSKKGNRVIPISDRVSFALRRVISNMQATGSETIIDGCEGFLFVNQYGNPRVSTNLEDALKTAVERYNKTSEFPLPKITPHMLRHTFCTNMANAGMEVKSLQYIMGHANSNMTLDVYSHINYETARASMQRILDAEAVGQ